MSLTSHSRVGNIHIAPCSCELHVRIRELEAELARTKDILQSGPAMSELLYQKARAEKAGLDVVKLANTVAEERTLRKATEARVAELEKKMWLYVLYVDKNTGGDGLTDEEIRAIIDRPLPFKGSLVEHGFIEKVKPAPAIEGQEREAD